MAREPEKRCFACPASYPAAYSSRPKCQLPLVFADIGKVRHASRAHRPRRHGGGAFAHHVEDHKSARGQGPGPDRREMKADRDRPHRRFQREAEAIGGCPATSSSSTTSARERDGSLYLAMDFRRTDAEQILKERGLLRVEAGAYVPGAVEQSAPRIRSASSTATSSQKLSGQDRAGKRRSAGQVVDFGVARLRRLDGRGRRPGSGAPVYMAGARPGATSTAGGCLRRRHGALSCSPDVRRLSRICPTRQPCGPGQDPHHRAAAAAGGGCRRFPRRWVGGVHAMCRDRDRRFRSCAGLRRRWSLQKNPQQVLWRKPDDLAPLACRRRWRRRRQPGAALAALDAAGVSRASLSGPNGPYAGGQSDRRCQRCKWPAAPGPAPMGPMSVRPLPVPRCRAAAPNRRLALLSSPLGRGSASSTRDGPAFPPVRAAAARSRPLSASGLQKKPPLRLPTASSSRSFI